MRRIVASWFLILTVLTNTSLSQVIIREKVQIQPAPRLIKTSTASSVSYFSPPTFLTPAVGLPRVALPSNITVGGSIDFAPSQLEPRQWVLLRLTGVGPAAIELHYIEKTIGGQLIERKGTFSGPVGVCGGGVPQLQTFDGSVGGSSIQFNNSGNQVTYTLTGSLRQGGNQAFMPVPATVTSSASAQPGFELAQWAIGPSQDSLVGSGSATLTITALNASGDQYFVCTTSNADATVTVSIQAQGAYAFLRGPDGQEGSSITIPFLSDDGFSAVKTCSVVLDESRRSLPGGRDVATVTVSGGPTATKQIVLRRALDHFFVEMGPPDIDFGSTSFVFVTAVNVFGSGVELADETMIRLTMDQPQYGTFIDLEGNERDTVDVSYYDAYVGNIQFFATGVNPDEDFKTIKVTASATIGGLLTTGSGQVVIKAFKPRCAVVVFDPDTLAPGDTASLSFQASEGEDGFPEGQRFDVHIFGNKGTLLAADGKTGNDLTGLSGQIRYVAPDTSLTVQLFAKTSPPSGPPVIITSVAGPGEVALGASANTNGENPFAALADVCVVSEVVIENEEFQILLGESKYYQAKFNEDGKIEIEEMAEPPIDPPALQAEFTVTAVEPKDTLAVYWENQYPLYKEDNEFVEMRSLSVGTIRLIGRYKIGINPYKVKLTAKNGDNLKEIVIEVKKPISLGAARRNARDVRDDPVDIDDLCVEYGGRFGISPQFIKGQIEIEARYMGDPVGFAPSYRYEPYTTQFEPWVIRRKRSPFFVTPSSFGNPLTPSHSHVQDIPYFTEIRSVWDIIENYSQLVDNISDRPHLLYGIRTANDTMDFVNLGYRSIQNEYHAMLAYFLDSKGGSLGLEPTLSLSQAADSARAYLIDFLRYRWHGGAENIVAQTRIASSYGLLQLTYLVAVSEEQYLEEELPEDLNLTRKGMNFAMKRQKRLLKEELQKIGQDESGNNWGFGYEKVFKFLLYPKWNKRVAYWGDVLKNARKYSPR